MVLKHKQDLRYHLCFCVSGCITLVPFCVKAGMRPGISRIYTHKTQSMRVYKVLDKYFRIMTFMCHCRGQHQQWKLYSEQLRNIAKQPGQKDKSCCSSTSHQWKLQFNGLGSTCKWTLNNSLTLFYVLLCFFWEQLCWTSGRISSLHRWQRFGKDCPERWWSSHPWRCPRNDWTQHSVV